MSRHRDPDAGRRRGRRRRSGRIRAILSLGIVLGLGGVNTMAFWTDTATLTTNPISSGTLDVTLNDQLAGAANRDETTNDAEFTVSNLVPGESFARNISVGNAGTVPYTFTATGHTTGQLGPSLEWTVVPGGAASNAPSDNLRTGSCSLSQPAVTPSPTVSAITMGTSAATATDVIASSVDVARRTVGVGASTVVCVIVRLDPSAANDRQALSATATFRFLGTQVGAP